MAQGQQGPWLGKDLPTAEAGTCPGPGTLLRVSSFQAWGLTSHHPMMWPAGTQVGNKGTPSAPSSLERPWHWGQGPGRRTWK